MQAIVVVTGASAGIGRATALEFARRGCDVALLARDEQRLEAVAEQIRAKGVRALPIALDVANGAAVDAAAARVEDELGAIDIWVNNAMATVFAPVSRITPEEFRRTTEVTYLGQVHGTMAALARMRRRNRGTIVNIGSALSYRSIPLQSAYCGAKHAVRGFTNALRSELLHDGLDIHLTMVHLPAVNTPQFDWALNKMGRRAQPVPPIYQPEVAARAIVFAARHRRREVWVGLPTIGAILANRIAPGWLDRRLARTAYQSQFTDELQSPGTPSNLFAPVAGNFASHGRFDGQSHRVSLQSFANRHRSSLSVALAALAGAGLGAALMRRRRPST